MPDRKELDRPATVILTVFGLLFMAGSIPFLPALYCKSPSHNPDLCPDDGKSSPVAYAVTWKTAGAGDSVASLAAAPGDANAKVPLNHVYTAEVRLTLAKADCQDQFNPQTQQSAATFTWSLKFNGTEIKKSDAPLHCADIPADGLTVVLPRATPKLGEVRAVNDTAASRQVAASVANQTETGTYELDLHADRAASPIPPLPAGNPAPTLSIKMAVKVQGNAASISKVTAEVGK